MTAGNEWRMILRLLFLESLGTLASVLVPLGILAHLSRRSGWFSWHGTGLGGLPTESAAAWNLLADQHRRRSRLAAGIVAGTLVLLVIANRLPGFVWPDWYFWLHVAPVFISMASVAALLLAPISTPKSPAGAATQLELSPRTLWSFGRRWWFAVWIVTTAVLALTVVFAGLLSSVDENGNHTLLTVAMGEASASTTFLGWFYGVPLLLGLAGSTVVTLLALTGIARPPLAGESQTKALDGLLRRTRVRTVLALGTGAVLVTLGMVWKLLSNAARMTGGVASGTAGQIDVGTSFAALAIPLWVGGYLVYGVGFALLLLPLFARAARPSPRAAVAADAPATSGVRV